MSTCDYWRGIAEIICDLSVHSVKQAQSDRASVGAAREKEKKTGCQSTSEAPCEAEVDAAKLCCKVKVTFTFFGGLGLFSFFGGISLYHGIESLGNNQTLKPGALLPSLLAKNLTRGRLPVVAVAPELIRKFGGNISQD